MICCQGWSVSVFVEVKYRRMPQKEILWKRLDRQNRSASEGRRLVPVKKGISQEVPCRFDVVGILGKEIVLVADAF